MKNSYNRCKQDRICLLFNKGVCHCFKDESIFYAENIKEHEDLKYIYFNVGSHVERSGHKK